MNKKILTGGSILITVAGAAIVGSIWGGIELTKSHRQNIQELKNKKEADQQATFTQQKNSQASLNKQYSIVSPSSAKLVFDLPTSFTDRTIILKYTKQQTEEDKKKGVVFNSETVSQYVAKDSKAIFTLTVLTPNYLYDYEILIDQEAVSSGSFLTKLTPTSTATSSYKGAELDINNLGSFVGRTLMIKAVPTVVFNPDRAEEQFRNTVLSQLFDIPVPADPTKLRNIKTKVLFKPVGMDNATEYNYVIFANEGLVPLTNLKSPAKFTTLKANLQVSDIYGYHTNGSLKLSNLEDFAGTTLKFGYHKVSSESGLFLPRIATFIDVKVGQNVNELILNVPNLEPNSIYKFNIFPQSDKAYIDAIFKGEKGRASSDFKIKTNARASVETTMEKLPNPMLEARAARVKFVGLAGYATDSLKVKVVKKPTSSVTIDWSAALTGTLSNKMTTTAIAADTSSDPAVEAVPAIDYWQSDIFGLEPNTDYVLQLIGGDDKTTLLDVPTNFKTMVGFTNNSVKIVVPLSNDGQTKANVEFPTDQLMQFYSIAQTSGAAKTTTQLEIRQIEVKSLDEEITLSAWNGTEGVTKKDVTITKTEDSYTAPVTEMTLTAGKIYKAALFYKELNLAPVSEIFTFESNTAITSSSVKLETKILISLENLKSYKGKELVVNLYKNAKTSSSEAIQTQKFIVDESLLKSLEFKGLEASTQYAYYVTVVNPTIKVTPPTDATDSSAVSIGATTNIVELLNETIQTASTTVEGRIPAETINPTSVMVKLFNLGPLKTKEISIVYRKKTQTPSEWTTFELGEITIDQLEKTLLETQPGLDSDTEYEFNLIWTKAPQFTILDNHVEGKTRKFVTIQTSAITQISSKLTYGDYALYPNQTFTLKYWFTTEKSITDDAKAYISSSNSTGTRMVSIPAKITDSTSIFSTLTGLLPNTNYAFQLFNGNVPVSDMQLFSTLKQLSVASTESFVSGFKVSLTNLETITGEGSDKLVMQVIEQDPDTGSTAQIRTFKFDKTATSQDVLAYGLKVNKKYVFQFFKQNDTEFKNPIITTNSLLDKRTVTLLTSTDVPKLKVEQVAAKSALLEFEQLSKFIGKTLIIKYKETYWDSTTSKNVEIEKTNSTIVDSNEMKYQLLELKPKTKYFYEVYVEVNNTKDKITLLAEKLPIDQRETFTTGGENIQNKAGANFILAKEGKLVFVNTLPYQGIKLVLKAVEKTTSPNWDGEGVISSVSQKIGYSGETKTADFTDANDVLFNLSTLKPKTEYIYQLFAEGLSEPLLSENGSFTTKSLIKLQITEVYPTKMRLLLSNLDTYVNQKLKVRYRTKTKDTTVAGTWNEYQTTVTKAAIGGTEFTSETLLPIPLEGLVAKTEYEFEVVAVESATTDSTVNLLEEPTISQTTLVKDLKAVFVPSAEEGKVKVTFYNLGNLKGHTFKLQWKEKMTTGVAETAAHKYDDARALEVTIPASEATTTTFEVPTGLVMDKTKEYELQMIPKYDQISYLTDPSTADSVLETTYGSSVNVANIQIAVNAKSTFTDKAETLASAISDKAKFEEKYDTPTVTDLTLEIKDNTETEKYFSSNDVEGKLFIVINVKNKDADSIVVKYVVTIEGFKKATPENPGLANTAP